MNKHSGERAIKLGDEEVVIRPSFEAICNIEGMLGVSVVVLLDSYLNSKPKMGDLAAIVYCCQKEKKYSFQEIGQKIYKSGMSSAVNEAFLCISDALSGGGDKKKDGQEITEK